MKRNRLLAFILVMVMSFAMVVTSASAVVRSSDYLSDYGIGIAAKGSGKMIVSFEVMGTGKMDMIGAYKLIIEEKVTPDRWITYTTAYGEDYPNTFYGYNTMIHSNTYSFIGTPGFRYRATLVAYAEKGSGSDTGEVTTVERLCK